MIVAVMVREHICTTALYPWSMNTSKISGSSQIIANTFLYCYGAGFREVKNKLPILCSTVNKFTARKGCNQYCIAAIVSPQRKAGTIRWNSGPRTLAKKKNCVQFNYTQSKF